MYWYTDTNSYELRNDKMTNDEMPEIKLNLKKDGTRGRLIPKSECKIGDVFEVDHVKLYLKKKTDATGKLVVDGKGNQVYVKRALLYNADGDYVSASAGLAQDLWDASKCTDNTAMFRVGKLKVTFETRKGKNKSGATYDINEWN